MVFTVLPSTTDAIRNARDDAVHTVHLVLEAFAAGRRPFASTEAVRR
jgi:hypothetical protein